MNVRVAQAPPGDVRTPLTPPGVMLHELAPRQVELTTMPLPGSAPLHEGVTAKGPAGQLPVGPP